MLNLLLTLGLSSARKNRPAITQNFANIRNAMNGEAEQCTEYYTLKAGESLTSITAGNKDMLRKIYELNRYINPQYLQEGDVILIPKECEKDDDPVKIYYMDSPEFAKNDLKTYGSLVFSVAYMLNYRTYNRIIELKEELISKGLIKIDDGVWKYRSERDFKKYLVNKIEAEGIKTAYNLKKYEYNDSDYFFVEILDLNNKPILTYNPKGKDKEIRSYDIELVITINKHASKPDWGFEEIAN